MKKAPRITILSLVACLCMGIFFAGDIRADETILGGGMGFSYGPDLSTVSLFEFAAHTAYEGSDFEYTTPILTVIPVLAQDSTPLFDFRGLINLGLFGLVRGLTRLTGDSTASWTNSPFRYALFLPNFRVDYPFAGNWKGSIGMQTDYLLARGHTGQRGIAFIPHIGITYSAESGYRMFNGITFFAGYGSFWNFDGENWSGRLTFGIRSFLTDIPH